MDIQTSEGRTPEHSSVTMSMVIMPEHAGPGGVYAHGGEIMKIMDTAAGLAAVRHAHSPVATLRVEGMNFKHPVRVGNYMEVQAKMVFASASTMEVQVKVTAENIIKEQSWDAVTAYFVIIALDEEGKAKRIPPLIVTSEQEKRLFEAGQKRYAQCRLDDDFKTLCAMDD